jgi:hypothetical protein
MGGALCLCCQIFDGHMGIHFQHQRGTFNSAWTGAVVTRVGVSYSDHYAEQGIFCRLMERLRTIASDGSRFAPVLAMPLTG